MNIRIVKKIALGFALLVTISLIFMAGLGTSYYAIQRNPENYLTLADPNMPEPIIGVPGKMFRVNYKVICSADPEYIINDTKSKGHELQAIFMDGNSSEERFMFNQIWINKKSGDISVYQMLNNKILCLIVFGDQYTERDSLKNRS